MAISPLSRYTLQIDGSDPTGYPFGKARDDLTPDDGTGTPLQEDWVNDLFGFQQALLAEVGSSPSGTPERVGASQYLSAIQALIASAVADLDVAGLEADVSALQVDVSGLQSSVSSINSTLSTINSTLQSNSLAIQANTSRSLQNAARLDGLILWGSFGFDLATVATASRAGINSRGIGDFSILDGDRIQFPATGSYLVTGQIRYSRPVTGIVADGGVYIPTWTARFSNLTETFYKGYAQTQYSANNPLPEGEPVKDNFAFPVRITDTSQRLEFLNGTAYGMTILSPDYSHLTIHRIA